MFVTFDPLISSFYFIFLVDILVMQLFAKFVWTQHSAANPMHGQINFYVFDDDWGQCCKNPLKKPARNNRIFLFGVLVARDFQRLVRNKN